MIPPTNARPVIGGAVAGGLTNRFLTPPPATNPPANQVVVPPTNLPANTIVVRPHVDNSHLQSDIRITQQTLNQGIYGGFAPPRICPPSGPGFLSICS